MRGGCGWRDEMAKSPAHQFGQIIGGVLEKAVFPGLDALARKHGLYLDIKGNRAARGRKQKVSWLDLHGNTHDLDFVVERHGTPDTHGAPVAFIECAWRRYTKHSKNKAQEIQGAISPLSDKYECHAPFVGVILAGDYTDPAMEQLRSLGYHVVHITYDSVRAAFKMARIDAAYDEDTEDDVVRKKIKEWNALSAGKQQLVVDTLRSSNSAKLNQFDSDLEKAITRHIVKVVVLPLHGQAQTWSDVAQAIAFVQGYNETTAATVFDRYEVFVHYNNGDKINGEFRNKDNAIDFLKNYLPEARLVLELPVRAGVKVIGGKPFESAT
jgi:hypothetical protein